MKSDFFKLNLRDFARGAIVAVITAAVGVIYGAVQTDFDLTWLYWKPVLIDTIKVSVQAFIAYIALNIFTNKTGGIGAIPK